jgi:hypothetical protein
MIMFARLLTSLGLACARFIKRADGAIAPTFAFALIPIATAVGAAVDYSRANNVRTELQAALDSAVLAGAQDAGDNWIQIATSVYTSNLAGKGMIPASTPVFTIHSPSIYFGTAAADVPTSILGIVHIDKIKVSVNAGAVGSHPDNSCILTLDKGQPASHVALTLNGAPVVNLTGCSIRSNTSVDCNGHDGNMTETFAAGSASGCGHPTSGATTVPDIYASLATNITPQCGSSHPGVTWHPGTLPSGSAFKTVDKGSYVEYHVCGELEVSGTGYLTPGGSTPTKDYVIVIENGNLKIEDNADIKTMRTAIVMTGDNTRSSQIDFPTGNSKNATLTLEPPSGASNPWQGVSLYVDPKLTNHSNIDNRWGPGATFNADGLVYMGNSNVVTDGNTSSSNAQCTKFVMNQFTTNGAVELNFSQAGNCGGLGLRQWAGQPVRLVQ